MSEQQSVSSSCCFKEISLSDIENASERIRKYIHKTPVLTNSTISQMTGIPNCTLYLKCENLNKVGAFKIRGACNAVLNALNNSDEEIVKKIKEGGVITHSSGNHAGALAKSAQMLGLTAHIVMPSNSPAVKKNAVELTYGARVILCEPTLRSREETCERIIQETGALFIHPYDNDDVITGQGTAVLEMLDQVKEERLTDEFPLDALIVPVGGGGLSSGSSICFKSKAALEIKDLEKLKKTKVIGVEPQVVDDAKRSMEQGKLVGNDPNVPANTVCDGLKTNLSERTFHHISKNIDRIFTVTDEQVIKAMKLVWERMKIVIEPSSATVVALTLFHDEFKQMATENQWQHIGMVISGGNCDLDALPWTKK
ncbi:predicted protein [Naegleria gruberi]|uniref:Serine racemase n=1 Tax=Naegleria gruberi TaxID=5762 RepID=D2VDG8_NAEGR|nr:uncharacterized protein NAEGRDRAFT_33171 [Naegleria gruberi]EFC45139.1 predicted protein [Naegleria gruberi]|eukprot:XP_002677883.1 predicted protein [Naegleria gruberi strain NEG-M]